jgi:hypothetical protein
MSVNEFKHIAQPGELKWESMGDPLRIFKWITHPETQQPQERFCAFELFALTADGKTATKFEVRVSEGAVGDELEAQTDQREFFDLDVAAQWLREQVTLMAGLGFHPDRRPQ